MVTSSGHGMTDLAAPCATCGMYHAAGAPCPVAAALPILAARQLLAPGAVLAGRFEIQAATHRSSMSTVYQAVDRRASSPMKVAVKEFSPRGLSPDEQAESLRWLAREAGLLSSLQDPHLPELLAAFSDGDRHYIVMPYLEGETIKERVERSGPLPVDEAIHWACTLADAVAYLHGQDPPIIHRDLKPDNILISPSNQLILLDLGVARPLARGTAGTAIGTPGYAPPEQYQGLADERSDLYALGATLHYMLTGYDAEHEAPFRHPPVRQLNPAIPPHVEQVVTNLLQLVPDQRPRVAADIRKELTKPYEVAASLIPKLYAQAAQYCLFFSYLSVLWATNLHLQEAIWMSAIWTAIILLPGTPVLARAVAGAVRGDAALRQSLRTIGLVAAGPIAVVLLVLFAVPAPFSWISMVIPFVPFALLMNRARVARAADDARRYRIAHGNTALLP